MIKTTHNRVVHYSCMVLSSALLFYSGVLISDLPIAVLVAALSFASAYIVEVHYFKIMALEIPKGAPAHNAEELGWEMVSNMLKDVEDLRTRVALLEEIKHKLTSRTETYKWAVSILISFTSVVIALLAVLRVI